MRKIREVPLIVLALTLASASVALAEQSAGVFQNMEAVSGKRILVLKDGRRFDVDKRAWSRYGQALDALKPGDPFDFAYTGGRLVSIGKGADGEAAKIDSERKIRWTGRFKSQKGKWLLLQNGRQEQISQAAIFDNPKKARILLSLTRGDDLVYWMRAGKLVDLKKGTLKGSGIDEEVEKILKWSKRNDKIHLQTKTEGAARLYRIKRKKAKSLELYPHVPDTADPPRFDTKATVTVRLKEIALLLNAAATTRRDEAGGDPDADGGEVDLGAVFDDVAVGDMIGIGFNKGQLTELDDENMKWRIWKRDVWGEELTKPRSSVPLIRPVELNRRESFALEGGKLELSVSRSRTEAQGGLKFVVDLKHTVRPVILVDLKIRFLLGGMTMGQDDPVLASETKTVDRPMFFDQQETIVFTASDSRFMDGRADVAVFPKNIVPIKSKAALKHILTAISRAKKLVEFPGIYLAAGENGDRHLCHLLLSRYMSQRDPVHRRHLLGGLKAFGQVAITQILEELNASDRDLERSKLLGRDRLARTPLPEDVRPVQYKRREVQLLTLLPRALQTENGQKLFDIYTRRDDLQDAIERAFKAKPRDAVTSLLGIATTIDTGGTENNEARARAEGAIKLLRALGKPILPALYAELKKHGIDPAPCQEIFARTGQASEAIRHGQYLLVQKYLQLQEEEWNRLITEAEEHKARKEWDEALVLIRKVLAAKPGFERANQLLPQVLVKKAVDHREAGERGAAAVAFEEALLQLPVGDRPKAAVPISELLIQAANEDVEQVVLRSHPHPAAGLVRPVALNETFMGEETESSTAAKVKYIKVKLKEGAEAYVLRSCVRAGAGSGEYAISVGVTPFKDVKRQIDTAKGFAPSLTASADEVFGRLSAREGKTKYEAGNYQAALAHFEEATKFAPTDPRLSLKFKCWLKANTGALVAVLGVVAFALGIAIMQAFARPKKVKFQGDFKHYGQDRSARERDLDLPEE